MVTAKTTSMRASPTCRPPVCQVRRGLLPKLDAVNAACRCWYKAWRHPSHGWSYDQEMCCPTIDYCFTSKFGAFSTCCGRVQSGAQCAATIYWDRRRASLADQALRPQEPARPSLAKAGYARHRRRAPHPPAPCIRHELRASGVGKWLHSIRRRSVAARHAARGGGERQSAAHRAVCPVPAAFCIRHPPQRTGAAEGSVSDALRLPMLAAFPQATMWSSFRCVAELLPLDDGHTCAQTCVNGRRRSRPAAQPRRPSHRRRAAGARRRTTSRLCCRGTSLFRTGMRRRRTACQRAIMTCRVCQGAHCCRIPADEAAWATPRGVSGALCDGQDSNGPPDAVLCQHRLCMHGQCLPPKLVCHTQVQMDAHICGQRASMITIA